jgi:hypothetical protein
VHRNFLLAKLFSIIGSYKMVLDGRLHLNNIISNGKRFMAYEIINRLEKSGNTATL